MTDQRFRGRRLPGLEGVEHEDQPSDRDRSHGDVAALLDAFRERLEALDHELRSGREARLFLELNERTRGWRALQGYRELRARLRAPDRLGRARGTAGDAGSTPRQPSALVALPAIHGPVRFARPARPAVSIVVPVLDQVELTRRCLAALASRTPPGLAEVVVVDDASAAATSAALRAIEGLTVLRNERNAGFLASCRRGADATVAEHLVFLNNDTEVQPGWLEALLDAARSGDDVGAVGAKLVYPDGRLQEAGCVVWSDASGLNVGRGRDPGAAPFNYRREVDYCSAAALLVRTEAFRRVGGFDGRFAPGYYEDTDLCFALRHAGYRVLYEPGAVVLHREGASHGTDASAGSAGGPGKPLQQRHRHLFAVKWAAELARHWPPGTAEGALGGRIDRRPRVLVVDTWVPAHDEDSGSLRMTWILRLLRSLGCHVTLVPLNGSRREPYTRELQRAGVEVLYGSAGRLSLPSSASFDLAVVSRPDVAEAVLADVRRSLPRATLVYDTVDLHFVREERRHRLGIETDPVAAARARRVELSAMRRADLVAAVSEEEAEIVRARVPGARTVVLPNVHEPDGAEPLPFEARRDFVFIGGFAHDPNVDAARHLVHDVMPLVWQSVDARLWLVGSWPPAEVTELASDRVVVTGHVPDVSGLFRRARVFVAPLRYGAGMKGKVGHALAFGVPVVTTPVGAEGMELEDGLHALVREGTAAFAEACVELYTDDHTWRRLSVCGRSIAAERWSPAAMQGRLERLVQSAVPPAAWLGGAHS